MEGTFRKIKRKRYCLAHLHWGADRTTLLRLYHSLIRSKIHYGCEFYAATSQNNIIKINSVHNQAIRLCTGAFRSSSSTCLHIESDEYPLEYHQIQLRLPHYARLKQLSHSSAYNRVISVQIQHQNSKHKTFGERMREVPGKLHLSKFNVIPYDNSYERLWKLPTDTEEIVNKKISIIDYQVIV